MVRKIGEKVWMDSLANMIDIFWGHLQAKEKERDMHLSEIGSREKDIKSLQLRCKVNSEIIAAKTAENQILEQDAEVLRKEISGLVINLEMYQQIIDNRFPINELEERKDVLNKLKELQEQLVKLMDAHGSLESEKVEQKEAIFKLNMLLKEKFEPDIDEKNIQVDEKELMWGMESVRKESILNPDFTHLNERTSCLTISDLRVPRSYNKIDLEQMIPQSIQKASKKSESSNLQDNMMNHLELDLKKVDVGTVMDNSKKAGLKNDGKKFSIKKKEKIDQLIAQKNQKPPAQIFWQLPIGICRFLAEISKDYKEVSVIA